MIGTFASVLGNLAAHKQIVGAWLLLLTLAVANIADKVYVERTAELAVIEIKIDHIQRTLDKMDITLEKNAENLTRLIVEQARVAAELKNHEEESRAADAKEAKRRSP